MMAKHTGSTSWTKNRLTSRLGVQYPIIQGPLGGLSSQRLTAAVSNYGGLGSFGAHGLKPEAIRGIIREIRGLTPKPFAMNLWVSMEDERAPTSTEEAFDRGLAPLAKHIESVGGPKPSYRAYEPIRFDDQAQVLLDGGITVFSSIHGIPFKQVLDEFRRKGIALIGTATTVDEAIALEQAGVDVIAASGFEAGGHRGSFLQAAEDSLTGTMALVPQVVNAVQLQVVAAGGIGDTRRILAAFALGAEGVQMGLPFSHARSRERARFIGRRPSVVKLCRQLLLAGSLEDLLAASKTACSTN
jgi:nitronate monooxygenase